jgi:hypothetical protein
MFEELLARIARELKRSDLRVDSIIEGELAK